MNKNKKHIIVIHCALFVFACGCESVPSTDGTWSGYILPVRLHDPHLSYDAACLRIVEGTPFVRGKESWLANAPPPEGPVLVDGEDSVIRVPNVRADQLVHIEGVYVVPGLVAGFSGPTSWGKRGPYGWGDTALQVLQIRTITDAQGHPIPIERVSPSDGTRLIPFTTQPAPP